MNIKELIEGTKQEIKDYICTLGKIKELREKASINEQLKSIEINPNGETGKGSNVGIVFYAVEKENDTEEVLKKFDEIFEGKKEDRESAFLEAIKDGKIQGPEIKLVLNAKYVHVRPDDYYEKLKEEKQND